jgi:flagellar protein FlgJ
MAINPPSDIVLDVLKAADPARIAAAEQRLDALRSSRSGATADFGASLDDVRLQSLEAANARARLAPASSSGAKAARQETEFEAMILNSFIREIIPKSEDGVFGKGFAGEMWRSMLADQIARQIAKSGSLGIAKRLFAAHPLAKPQAAQVHGGTEANALATALTNASASSAEAGPSTGDATTVHQQDEVQG